MPREKVGALTSQLIHSTGHQLKALDFLIKAPMETTSRVALMPTVVSQ